MDDLLRGKGIKVKDSKYAKPLVAEEIISRICRECSHSADSEEELLDHVIGKHRDGQMVLNRWLANFGPSRVNQPSAEQNTTTPEVSTADYVTSSLGFDVGSELIRATRRSANGRADTQPQRQKRVSSRGVRDESRNSKRAKLNPTVANDLPNGESGTPSLPKGTDTTNEPIRLENSGWAKTYHELLGLDLLRLNLSIPKRCECTTRTKQQYRCPVLDCTQSRSTFTELRRHIIRQETAPLRLGHSVAAAMISETCPECGCNTRYFRPKLAHLMEWHPEKFDGYLYKWAQSLGFHKIAPVDRSPAVGTNAIQSQESEASGVIEDKAATTTTELTWAVPETSTFFVSTNQKRWYDDLSKRGTWSPDQLQHIDSDVLAARAGVGDETKATPREVSTSTNDGVRPIAATIGLGFSATNTGTAKANHINTPATEDVTSHTNGLPSQVIATLPPHESDEQFLGMTSDAQLAAHTPCGTVPQVALATAVEVAPVPPRNELAPSASVASATSASQITAPATVTSSSTSSLVPETGRYPLPHTMPPAGGKGYNVTIIVPASAGHIAQANIRPLPRIDHFPCDPSTAVPIAQQDLLRLHARNTGTPIYQSSSASNVEPVHVSRYHFSNQGPLPDIIQGPSQHTKQLGQSFPLLPSIEDWPSLHSGFQDADGTDSTQASSRLTELRSISDTQWENTCPTLGFVPRIPYPLPSSTPLVEAGNLRVSQNSSRLGAECQGGGIPQIAQGKQIHLPPLYEMGKSTLVEYPNQHTSLGVNRVASQQEEQLEQYLMLPPIWDGFRLPSGPNMQAASSLPQPTPRISSSEIWDTDDETGNKKNMPWNQHNVVMTTNGNDSRKRHPSIEQQLQSAYDGVQLPRLSSDLTLSPLPSSLTPDSFPACQPQGLSPNLVPSVEAAKLLSIGCQVLLPRPALPSPPMSFGRISSSQHSSHGGRLAIGFNVSSRIAPRNSYDSRRSPSTEPQSAPLHRRADAMDPVRPTANTDPTTSAASPGAASIAAQASRVDTPAAEGIASTTEPDSLSHRHNPMTVERMDRAHNTISIHTAIVEVAPESSRNETPPLALVGSTTPTSQIPAVANHFNYEAFEQPVASAQDPNRSYNTQPEINQSDQGMSSRLRLRERQQQSEEFIPYFTQDARLISTAWIPAAPFADNEFVFHSNRNDVQGFFSDRSRVLHSPSPPQALLVAESLFHNIKVYFEDSCRNMILDDHGTPLNPNGAELHNDLCNDFDSYCFTATMFKGRKLHVEFRRALSKASALVEQILRAEHPRTLACFLEVFIHLIQTGLPEVTSILRDFIKRMSAKVTRKGHPWGQICRLLGELDSESLDQAMAQIWKCTTDTFESELGTFSRLTVSVRLDYIKRVYGFTNYLEEERLLRDLLAQFDGIPRVPTPRVMLNLAHNLNRQGRHNEAEKTALEVLLLLKEYEIYAKRIVERIECMKIVSRSQFNQGKTLAAGQTMREAIRMIVDQWGIQHSWVLEFMNVLEGWLRDWGWEEDANKLWGEIEELIGKDEIDEQLDGV